MKTVLKGKDQVLAAVGSDLGPGDWYEVTQDQVNLFADATYDHQWIHVDPERAKEGPFGGPIAHGYFTMSVMPMLLHSALSVEGTNMGVNYGLNKLRFPAPVHVGSRIRIAGKVKEVTEVGGGAIQVVLDLAVEVEGKDKPAMVAEPVYRYYF